jgi:hypothetical protein
MGVARRDLRCSILRREGDVMAKFFVGQTVRVRCQDSEMDGFETRIVALDVEGEEDDIGVYVGAEVMDTCGANYAGDFDTYVFEYHELEPIIPEGMKPSTWEQCEWQPEGVSA